MMIHDRRFFSPDSFWNRPIPGNAPVDPANERLIASMNRRWGPLHINCEKFAMPVYEVDPSTPRVRVAQRGPRPDVPAMLARLQKRLP